MPLHVRTQIRNAAVALLADLPTTDDRVFPGRTRALAADHDPALLVYTRLMRSQPDTQGDPAIMLHDLQLFVEGRAVASEPPDDTTDQIEVEVVAKIFELMNVPGLKLHSIELRASTTNAQAPGERHEGEVRTEFAIQFRTFENDLTTFV